jgi:hypothetical protein
VTRGWGDHSKLASSSFTFRSIKSLTSLNWFGRHLLRVGDTPVQALPGDNQRALVATAHRLGGVELLAVEVVLLVRLLLFLVQMGCYRHPM